MYDLDSSVCVLFYLVDLGMSFLEMRLVLSLPGGYGKTTSGKTLTFPVCVEVEDLGLVLLCGKSLLKLCSYFSAHCIHSAMVSSIWYSDSLVTLSTES